MGMMVVTAIKVTVAVMVTVMVVLQMVVLLMVVVTAVVRNDGGGDGVESCEKGGDGGA